MDTLEQLRARHRKEQRDLQAIITQKKKGATKKTRKGVNTECEELERSQKEKHEQESAALGGDTTGSAVEVSEYKNGSTDDSAPSFTPNGSADDPVDVLPEALENLTIPRPPKSEDGETKKRNRQKERLARRAAEQEAATREAEAEAAKLPNWKRQERNAMLKTFEKYGLIEKEIVPDGHCLFSAVADQLVQTGIPLGQGGEAVSVHDGKYRIVRKTAARYLEGHPDEFAGFLDEPLGSYVHKIRETAEWGGQLELIAIAKSYNIKICVIQDGRVDSFEPEADHAQEREQIWLAYYRHSYGLGEHYNSLRRAP